MHSVPHNRGEQTEAQDTTVSKEQRWWRENDCNVAYETINSAYESVFDFLTDAYISEEVKIDVTIDLEKVAKYHPIHPTNTPNGWDGFYIPDEDGYEFDSFGVVLTIIPSGSLFRCYVSRTKRGELVEANDSRTRSLVDAFNWAREIMSKNKWGVDSSPNTVDITDPWDEWHKSATSAIYRDERGRILKIETANGGTENKYQLIFRDGKGDDGLKVYQGRIQDVLGSVERQMKIRSEKENGTKTSVYT